MKSVRRPSNEKKLKEKLLPLSVLVLNGRVGLDTKCLRCPLAQMAQQRDEDQDVTLDTPSLEWRWRWQLSSNRDSDIDIRLPGNERCMGTVSCIGGYVIMHCV